MGPQFNLKNSMFCPLTTLGVGMGDFFFLQKAA